MIKTHYNQIKNKIVNLFNHKIILIFLLFIIGISFADILMPSKNFSEIENRTLKELPKFSFTSFLKGSFSSNYEKYIDDQFIMRDSWINIKSFSEKLLMKKENNNILLGEHNYLFEKVSYLTEDESSLLQKNISLISKFLKNYKGNKSFMIVPSSYEIYKDLAPKHVPLINQSKYISDIYSTIENHDNSINTINILPTLIKNKDNYIYYRTDHHWTTKGAYLAYEQFKTERKFPQKHKNYSHPVNTVENFYGTYFSKSKNFNAVPDTINYYDFNNLTVNIDGKSYDSIYDLNKFNGRDKYEAFLHGNNGLTVMTNTKIAPEGKNKRILLFKDSYANCFAPFLTEDFEEVWVIDLRSYNNKISELLKNNSFDEILIEYSFSNLIKDTNIIKLNW